jgi:hypothetical protein
MTIGAFRFPMIKIEGGGGDPNPAVYCPANGYIIDPDIYIPEFEIPVEETDEKIVLIVSSEMDSAVSFIAQVSSTGQYTSKVYNMVGELKLTVNTNNNVITHLSLLPSYGSLHSDGFYRFKVIITPAIITNSLTLFSLSARSGFGENGWPIKEAHFYTPNIIYLSGTFSTRAKIMTYIKFYSSCDSLTVINSFAVSCLSLIECILPTTMNSVTNINSMFMYDTELRKVQWPEILPECLSANSLFERGGLKKLNDTNNKLPVMPKVTAINNMFQYNNVIEEVEISNDFPLLENCSNFVLWSTSIKTLKMTGNVGNPTLGCNMDWYYGYNYDKLIEVRYPTTLYLTGIQPATMGKSCYNLKKIILPTTMFTFASANNATYLGSLEDCYALSEITQVINGSNDVCYRVALVDTFNIISYWQPTFKLYGFYISGGTAARPMKLSSLECDWAVIQSSNFYGGAIAFSIRYASFDVTEINRIFTALPSITVTGTIDFRNNPGYAACNKAIAQAKGWTVL